MEKIVVRNKPISNIFYAFLSLLLSLLFIWGGSSSFDPDNISAGDVILWIAALLSITGTGFFLWRAFDKSPTITFDDEGISSKYFSAEKVYWNEIAEVQIIENETILLKLNNENKYMNEIQSSRLLQKMPHLAFNLNFTAATMNANEALEIINRKTHLKLKQ